MKMGYMRFHAIYQLVLYNSLVVKKGCYCGSDTLFNILCLQKTFFGSNSEAVRCRKIAYTIQLSSSLWISSSLQKSHNLDCEKYRRPTDIKKAANHIPSASRNCMEPRGHNDMKKVAYWPTGKKKNLRKRRYPIL